MSESVKNQKISILFLIGSLGVGGKERQLIELIHGLPEDRFACHLFVKNLDAYYISRISEKLDSLHSLGKDKFNLFDSVTVAKQITKLKPDIVCSWTNVTSHFALFAQLMTRHRYSIMNCCIRNAPNKLSVVLRLERMLYSLYACVVANSYAGLVAYGQSNKRGRYVLYNGFDMSRIPVYSQNEARAKVGLDKEKTIIVMVASCTKLKDHETLLRGFVTFCKKNTSVNCQLVLVGDGDRRSYLENMVSELGISSLVTFMGRRDDVEVILRASDVSVLSSTSWFGEGISNSILESLACGIPVIASDSPGTREVIEDGKNGFLFPAGDHQKLAEKLQTLLTDSSTRNDFVQCGKKTLAEKFSIPSMIESFEIIAESCDRF